jgi:pilus assembly protein CpaD
MHANRAIWVLALTLLVGACAPVTTYTDAEAPKNLKLDTATTRLDLRFAPGSAALAGADAAHLRQLAANGSISPSDRVTIAAAGPPALAEQRVATVSSLLQHYGVVPIAQPLAQVPPERAVLEVVRTLVTLPPCPNWSKPSGTDFGNQPSSNFGCATETNLGMMVANPSDLANALPVGGAAGQPAAAAVNRYLNDKVQLPTANTALPVAPSGTQGQQGNQGSSGNTPSSSGS